MPPPKSMSVLSHELCLEKYNVLRFVYMTVYYGQSFNSI